VRTKNKVCILHDAGSKQGVHHSEALEFTRGASAGGTDAPVVNRRVVGGSSGYAICIEADTLTHTDTNNHPSQLTQHTRTGPSHTQTRVRRERDILYRKTEKGWIYLPTKDPLLPFLPFDYRVREREREYYYSRIVIRVWHTPIHSCGHLLGPLSPARGGGGTPAPNAPHNFYNAMCAASAFILFAHSQLY
jgi:hypothetical protein